MKICIAFLGCLVTVHLFVIVQETRELLKKDFTCFVYLSVKKHYCDLQSYDNQISWKFKHVIIVLAHWLSNTLVVSRYICAINLATHCWFKHLICVLYTCLCVFVCLQQLSLTTSDFIDNQPKPHCGMMHVLLATVWDGLQGGILKNRSKGCGYDHVQ